MTAIVPAQGLSSAESRYSYDPLYQLVKAQYPAGVPFNGELHAWTYDAIGNRLTNTVNGVPQSYAYLKNGSNPLNGQRLSSDGINAYTYDPNGSQLARTGPGGSYGFGYDADNRLASITGAETATYTYDYQGRRTSKTEAGVTTTYLYDGLNPIAETVAGAPRYVLNGSSIDEPLAVYSNGSLSYLNADGLGSIIATNDATGTSTHSLSFDAWGVPRNETGTRAHGFTYTGREVGIAGLHFYRARFLQPGVGRFAAEDAVLSPQPYAHTLNSPLAYVDHSGWWPTKARGPYIGNVHQAAIDRALGFLPARDRAYIQWMQLVADSDAFQTEDRAYMHAMAAPGEFVDEAWLRANCYVSQMMADAIDAEKSGRHLEALRKFGMALHTIQDATSPSHYLFQTWHDPYAHMLSGAPFAAAEHLKDENYDPGAGSQLDQATRWMWDIFSGMTPQPADYFGNVQPDPRKPPDHRPW